MRLATQQFPRRLGEAVRQYLEVREDDVTDGRIIQKTLHLYAKDLQDFAELAGEDRPLDDIEPEELDEVVRAFVALPDRRRRTGAKSGLPPASPRRARGSEARFRVGVIKFFRYAVDEGWIRGNPARRMTTVPTVSPRKAQEQVGLSPAQVRALLNVGVDVSAELSFTQATKPVRDQAILRVLLETGVTIRDLAAVDREDFAAGPPGPSLLVGAGELRRTVSISVATSDLIVAFQRVRPDPDPRASAALQADGARALFVSWVGLRLLASGYRRLVISRGEQLGGEPGFVSVTPLALRFTFAIQSLAAGWTMHDVAVNMGLQTRKQLALFLEARQIRDQY